MITVFLTKDLPKPISTSRIWSKPLTSLVSAVLVTALLAILALWLQDKKRYKAMLMSQGTTVMDLRKQNQDLLNRLMSKDPMTLATLQTLTSTDSTFEQPPVGIGTDYAEYQAWRSTNPTADEQLLQDELAELGIEFDSNQS